MKTSEKNEFSAYDNMPHVTEAFVGVTKAFSEVASFYGFERIHLSPFENVRPYLTLVKAGFFAERPPLIAKTRSGDEFLLRPSGGLGIIRAYMSHKMYDLQPPLKFFTEGENFFLSSNSAHEPMVSEEIDAILIGEDGPIAEAEIIQTIWKAFETMKLLMDRVVFRINATGCVQCRTPFRTSCMSYMRSRASRLCKNCKRNLKRSPTLIFLCKEEKCMMVAHHAPQILDFLCDICKKHLRGLLEFLDEVGIPYILEPKLFRDGSWYNQIIFEGVYRISLSSADGESKEVKEKKETGDTEHHLEQTVESGRKFQLIAEGGRLSKAGSLLANKHIDVAAGKIFLEVLAQLYKGKKNQSLDVRRSVFLVQLGELAKRKSLALLEMLRSSDIGVRESLGRDSIKAQLRVAEKMGIPISLIIGQKEALDKTVIVREMESSIQETIPQEKLIEFLKKKLKK